MAHIAMLNPNVPMSRELRSRRTRQFAMSSPPTPPANNRVPGVHLEKA
jgi:hypothetical protein